MKACMVIGKPNVGKTLFMLHFAEYLGATSIQVTWTRPQTAKVKRVFSVPEARSALAGPDPHFTQCLQSVVLELPKGKGRRRFEVVDSTGIQEGIHSDSEVRRAMAQTLAAVRDVPIILHVIDASKVGHHGAVEALGDVDYHVAQFAQMRDAYAILANKMDIPGAEDGLRYLQREFVGHPIFPISALRLQGFQEVKRFVLQHI